MLCRADYGTKDIKLRVFYGNEGRKAKGSTKELR